MQDGYSSGRKTSSLRQTLATKQRVFEALVVRFVIGRYGRENIGFMWTVVEPMLLCVGVMVLWSATKSSHHGVNIVAFVLTGYMPLTLWRHHTGYMVNFPRHTKFLTVFHHLTVFDAMISRLILEFLSVSAATLVVFFALFAFGLVNRPYDVAMVLQGWLLMGAMSASAGVLIAALSESSELVEKLNQPVQYFMLPLSGCFFMVDWLPDSVKAYAVYIPLVNAYEIIRGGFYGPEFPTYGSASYALGAALLTAGLGFFLFERIKDHIEG